MNCKGSIGIYSDASNIDDDDSDLVLHEIGSSSDESTYIFFRDSD